eukprot:15467792-Alexandrium_andersonii.AAC.1
MRRKLQEAPRKQTPLLEIPSGGPPRAAKTPSNGASDMPSGASCARRRCRLEGSARGHNLRAGKSK